MPSGSNDLPKDGAGKILPLTSLRFLAAFYVLIFHASPIVWWLYQPNFLGRLVALGYTAVSFFFLLSGFVLALAYLRPGRPLKVRSFFVARFARIYPLLFVSLLLDLPHSFYASHSILHQTARQFVGALAVSFTALESWIFVSGLNDPSWSISDEFFFYLVFPFIAIALWKMRGRSMWIFAILLYLFANWIVFAFRNLSLPGFRLDLNPVSHLPEFVLGICLAKLFEFLSNDRYWSAFMRRWSFLAVALACLAFLAIPAFSLRLPVMLLQHALLMPIFGVVVLAFSSGNRTLEVLFARRWFVILGEASFALYLLHVPIRSLLRGTIERYPFVATLAYVLFTIALSVASFLWFETPARKRILALAHVRPRENEVTQAVAQ